MLQQLVVRPETPDQPEVVRLLRLADERAAALYPAESRHGLSLPGLLEQATRFHVARIAGRAEGCGGFVMLTERYAEMKRVFVTEFARGQGIGRAIVEALEGAAIAEGVRRMYLETGMKSEEALRLYRRLGYEVCEPFAAYGPDPLSVFMVKPIGGASPINLIR